ncbi:hypothetical protein PMAYCL1PPCAC_13488, partial [Pristionchus mayeri]
SESPSTIAGKDPSTSTDEPSTTESTTILSTSDTTVTKDESTDGTTADSSSTSSTTSAPLYRPDWIRTVDHPDSLICNNSLCICPNGRE